MVGGRGFEPLTSAMQCQQFYRNTDGATVIGFLQQGNEVLQVFTIRSLRAPSTFLTEIITRSSYIVMHNYYA